MALTVCLIFLTLILLSTATQFLYRGLMMDMLADDVSASATAAGSAMELLGADNNRSRQQLCLQLDYTARATGNDTVVCDESGTITACSCGLQSCEHLGWQFDRQLLDEIPMEGTLFRNSLRLGCYGELRMAALCRVQTRDGGFRYVVSSRSAAAVNQRLSDICHRRQNSRTVRET